jgi:hypothetical protein
MDFRRRRSSGSPFGFLRCRPTTGIRVISGQISEAADSSAGMLPATEHFDQMITSL